LRGWMMTDAAYKVWEAFKAELIVEPTDDMKDVRLLININTISVVKMKV